MKAVLEFELPADQEELNYAQQGWKFYSMICDFDEWLRRRYKHSAPKNEDVNTELMEVWQHWMDMLSDKGIEI